MGNGEHNTSKGILCVVVSAFGFAAMAVFVKLAGELPTAQKVVFRNLVAMALSAGMIIKTRSSFFGKKENQLMLILRSLFGMTGVFCNFYAVDRLVLSDAAMLSKMSPFFTVLFCAIFLGERVTWAHILAFTAAFGGSLFIIKPSMNIASSPALIGLAGGAGAGAAYGFLRVLGKREKPYTVIFYFSLCSTLAALAPAIRTYTPMTGGQVTLLLLAGLAAGLGQFAVTAAYRYAPSREISIFNYTDMLFSTAFSFLFFGALPDRLSAAGYAVIFAASLFLFFYNKRRGASH